MNEGYKVLNVAKSAVKYCVRLPKAGTCYSCFVDGGM